MLEQTGIFEVVSESDVKAAIGDQFFGFDQMERNDWGLAREIGKGVHADYVMTIVRKQQKGMQGVDYLFHGVLINAETGKNFKSGFQISGVTMSDRKEAGERQKQTNRAIFNLAKEDMLAAARKFRHSRLPMFDETPDTIVGVLNARALLMDPSLDLADVIEFPSFVPESMNLMQLLKSLQRQRRGLAIVLDEFGGTAGIVTMQDILEQMVGKIRSEGETDGFVMEKLKDGAWRVSGTMRLDDFRREYPELGEVPDVDTMGGLMVHQCETVPAIGETTLFRGLKLTALAGDERRVRELRVETNPRPSRGSLIG